jgi:hypothetical protein
MAEELPDSALLVKWTEPKYNCCVKTPLITLLALAAVSVASFSAPVQAQAAAADTVTVRTVTLQDGSVLQGRLTAETADSIVVVSSTYGQLRLARSAVRSISGSSPTESFSTLAAVPTISHQRAKRAQWSSRLEIGIQALSALTKPDAEGNNIGGAIRSRSVGLNLARSGPSSTMKLGLQTNYFRQDPYPAAANDLLLTITAARDLGASPYRVVAQTFVERNHPQSIDLRVTQQLGIGRLVVKSKRLSMFLAPGVAYSYANAKEDAQLAVSQSITLDGVGVGVYESIMWQVIPSVAVSQNFFSTVTSGRRQSAAAVTLSGMIAPRVGVNVVYNRRYDSGMVDPVNKTFTKLVLGIQLSR